ncbi:hypothetical protein P7C70_g7952, partial [Phenoliferia sp. Uapishka_3]
LGDGSKGTCKEIQKRQNNLPGGEKHQKCTTQGGDFVFEPEDGLREVERAGDRVLRSGEGDEGGGSWRGRKRVGRDISKFQSFEGNSPRRATLPPPETLRTPSPELPDLPPLDFNSDYSGEGSDEDSNELLEEEAEGEEEEGVTETLQMFFGSGVPNLANPLLRESHQYDQQVDETEVDINLTTGEPTYDNTPAFTPLPATQLPSIPSAEIPQSLRTTISYTPGAPLHDTLLSLSSPPQRSFPSNSEPST